MNKVVSCVLILILLCMTAVSSLAETAYDVTRDCAFRVSSGKRGAVTDNNTNSVWTPSGDSGTCYIKLPEGGAGYLQVEWKIAPNEQCSVIQYREDQSEIVATKPDGNLVQLVPLEEDARYAFLEVGQPKQGICGVCLYSRGELPDSVQNWEPPYEKCDLMVISTHQDDEWLWFGGIIPYYENVMGKRVQVVYMANCSRYRYAEALDGLWAGGQTHFPVFIGLKDERIDSLNRTVADWGGKDNVLMILSEMIRKYKPEVILTHDWDGEYGHNQHKATSRAMEYAIQAAADPAQYPESASVYGAWQVKKLYRHLETKSPITFDWNISYPELNGQTPLEICRAAYAKHKSQQKYFQVEEHGKYDNSKFGLSYSTVGDDTVHRDLFEGIAE